MMNRDPAIVRIIASRSHRRLAPARRREELHGMVLAWYVDGSAWLFGRPLPKPVETPVGRGLFGAERSAVPEG